MIIMYKRVAIRKGLADNKRNHTPTVSLVLGPAYTMGASFGVIPCLLAACGSQLSSRQTPVTHTHTRIILCARYIL